MGLTGRVRVRCPNDTRETDGAVFSTGRVSVSNQGLSVDPGPKVVWNVGCTATESLPNHGLPGGPRFIVPAPAKARLSGTKSFSTGCKDSYSHEYDRPGLSNGHAFKGDVAFWVKLTPFPASKLVSTKKALRDRTGKALPGGPGPPVPRRTLKDCP